MSNKPVGNDEEFSKEDIIVPSFWLRNPRLWFIQLETQFDLANITSDTKKYYYLVSYLDDSLANQVENILRNPPRTGKYDLIKEQLCVKLLACEELRIGNLLQGEVIGDQTPSKFLEHLRNLAGKSSVTDEVIKPIWLKKLPQYIMERLMTQSSTNLDALAERADRILKINQDKKLDTELYDLASQVGVLTSKIGDISRKIFEGSTYIADQYRLCSGLGAECWYHRQYGNRANKCQYPCIHFNGFR